MGNSSKNDIREYLTTTQVADMCRVNRATVVRWIQRGELTAERTLGGRYRIRSDNLLKQAAEDGVFIAADQKELLETAVRKDMPRPEPAPDPDDSDDLDRPRILVIDDDQSFRDLLFQYLSLLGYKVVLADNGFRGLDILLKDYAVKLVILDLLMPGISGVETLDKIKTMRKDIPIIITSGFLEYYFPDGEESLLKDVDKVLRKPFDLDQLASVCTDLLPLS